MNRKKAMATADVEKIPWSGRLVGVQPHIRLMRSFDERNHSRLGYVLRVEATVKDQPARLCRDRHPRQGESMIAIGRPHKRSIVCMQLSCSAIGENADKETTWEVFPLW